MSSIQNRILKLPQFLQDYISMYNVSHRIMMKDVFNELKFYHECILCDNCGSNIKRATSVYNEVLFSQYYYCGEWCAQDHEYDIRRSYRKSLKNTSITHG